MFTWDIAALLFHQLGTLGLFLAIGLDWLSTTQLRRVQTVELARLWATIMQPLAIIYAVSEVFLLTTGIFLVQTAWGWFHAWIDLSLGATLVLAGVGTAVGGSRLQAIRRLLASLPGGPLPASLEHRTRDPVLLVCVRTLALLSVGIVVLMVVQPASWWSCIGVLLGAVLIGLIAAVPTFTTQRRDAACSEGECNSMIQISLRFRMFRLTLLAAGILLILQYVFGMLVNLYVQFPNALPGGNAWGWAFTKSVSIQIHVYLGTLLLVVALASLILSVLVRSIPVVVASIIGFAMIILAYLGGIWFLTYGQQSTSSLWMALGFLGAVLAYGQAYVATRHEIGGI